MCCFWGRLNSIGLLCVYESFEVEWTGWDVVLFKGLWRLALMGNKDVVGMMIKTCGVIRGIFDSRDN